MPSQPASATTALAVIEPLAETESPEGVTPPLGPAASCRNGSRYIEDLTIPDGAVVAPGQTIDKRWSVQNSGTCDWGPDYRLVHVSGEGLTGPDELALYPAVAGADAVWQVILQAPTEAGTYDSRWPDGSFFGDEVYVVIVVAAAGAPIDLTPSLLP
jgi:hypothetical protein